MNHQTDETGRSFPTSPRRTPPHTLPAPLPAPRHKKCSESRLEKLTKRRCPSRNNTRSPDPARISPDRFKAKRKLRAQPNNPHARRACGVSHTPAPQCGPRSRQWRPPRRAARSPAPRPLAERSSPWRRGTGMLLQWGRTRRR